MSADLPRRSLWSRCRPWLAALVACLSAAVMIIGAAAITTRHTALEEIHAALIVTGGLLLTLLAQWLYRPYRPPPPADHFISPAVTLLSPRQRFFRRGAVALAVLISLVQAEINGYILRLDALSRVSHHVQFALYVLTALLLIWGLSDQRWRWPRDAFRTRPRRLEAGFIAALFLLALFLRLHHLEALRAFIDEANFLWPTLRFTRESHIHLAHPLGPIAVFPILYPYLQSLALPFSDSVLIALRIPAAIFGALAVPALYLLGKYLFNRPVAAVAALLLLTFPPHLQWSRFGMNNIADSPFLLLMLMLVVRGVQRGGRGHFVLAGVCFGLTHFFYEGGRLVSTGLVIVWLLYLMPLMFWRRLPRRNLFVFLFAAIVIALPVYTTLAAHGLSPTERYQRVRVNEVERYPELQAVTGAYIHRLRVVVDHFIYTKEVPIFYGGEQPYIHIYLLPLLLMGLGVLAWRWYSPAGLLLIVWIFGTGAITTLLLQSVISTRLMALFPPLMLVCALGGVELLRIMTPRHPRVFYGLAAGVALAVSALNGLYYFGVHIDTFTRQHYRLRPEQELIFHVATLDGVQNAYFITSRRMPQADLAELSSAYTPHVALHTPPLRGLDRYIDTLPYAEGDVFYLIEQDLSAHYMLQKRFDLGAPVRWHNPYAPEGVTYVLYADVSDRKEAAP